MDSFELYHGGTRWAGRPEIRASKEGRYEGGIGLYFTTSWLTAREYAKGGKVITVAKIKSDFTPIDKVFIERDTISEFLSTTKIKSKKDILADIDNHIAHRNKGTAVSANIFNNLVVNYRAGSGKAGLEVSKFLASQGAEAEIQRHGGQDWLLVLNPDIILSHRVLSPKEKIVFELPRIESPAPSLAAKTTAGVGGTGGIRTLGGF